MILIYEAENSPCYSTWPWPNPAWPQISFIDSSAHPKMCLALTMCQAGIYFSLKEFTLKQEINPFMDKYTSLSNYKSSSDIDIAVFI